MTKRQKPVGTCLLTKDRGPLVGAHIIPRFVGDKALGQAHRIQFGDNFRPELRFNGWTDHGIVTAKGEERLRDIDTAAAKILQRHGLIWRYFPITDRSDRKRLAEDIELIAINEPESKALRLFFLSVLWRSAVTTRYEFADITLGQDETELLRKIVTGEAEPSDADFPSVLVLLTTQGEPQTHTPLAQIIDMRSLGFDLPSVPIFRFFFDGLIVHMGRKPADWELLDNWAPGRVVGASDKLVLIGRPYNGSTQAETLEHHKQALTAQWPEEARSIYSALRKIDVANEARLGSARKDEDK